MIYLWFLFGVVVYKSLCLAQSSQNNQLMLCPMDYWPASVNTMDGPFQTERTFKLRYMSEVTNPMCQFCPQVGCYVVRRSRLNQTEGTTTNTPLPLPTSTTPATTTQTITPDALKKDQSDDSHYLYMSCDIWSRLPPPSEIVSYLDCVMIGLSSNYYLFIYEPRFTDSRVPVVDCVDADFLAWIQNGTKLLGLELGFRMKAIPPFLFRYYQHIMQSTEYICIDGSSLQNKSIPFEDTERFASNKLRQVVFRSDRLQRNRRPPKPPDGQYSTEYQSEEEIVPCPHIVQHKPANITPDGDCQFSPAALPTTSDRVDREYALNRCPYRPQLNKNPRPRKRKPHTGLVEELRVPSSVLYACLLVVVIGLTIGIIVAFCILNAEKLMLCRTRSRKRREREAALAQELAEQAAKEAAAAADAEARQANAWHPIYGRYGVIPPNMGGAFGAFATRTMDVPQNQQQVMGMNQASRPQGNFGGPPRGHM